MMGRKNYESYFLPFNTSRSHEVIGDVEMVEFDTEDEMFVFIENIKSTKFLNFSLEHKRPCLLKFVV